MSEIKTLGLEDNLSYRGAPYQQLITDKDGNAQWEDRLAYSESTDVTIMEEQTVEFADHGHFGYGAILPNVLNIKSGDKLTVIWDGTSYNVIVSEEFIKSENYILLSFGNFDLVGYGKTSDYPFFCQVFRHIDDGSGRTMWMANDTAESHTIKVIGQNFSPISTITIYKKNQIFNLSNIQPQMLGLPTTHINTSISNRTMNMLAIEKVTFD